jgi:hypothetical protein
MRRDILFLSLPACLGSPEKTSPAAAASSGTLGAAYAHATDRSGRYSSIFLPRVEKKEGIFLVVARRGVKVNSGKEG